MRIRLLAGALALAIVATACPQESEPIAECVLPDDRKAVPVLTRNSSSQRHILAVIHPGIGTGAVDRAFDLIDDAVATGAQITIWNLRSSQSSGMERVVDQDFRGTAQTDDGIRYALRRPRAAALCSVLDASLLAPLDDGADLLGALERLIDEASADDAETKTELVLLTGGGVHRTIELELGDESVTPASFQPHIERIQEALERSSALPAGVEVIGVGTFEGAVSPPSRSVADLANRLWDDVCQVIKEKGVSCFQKP